MVAKKNYSVLYVPGVNERAMKKASSLRSDVIIFDLEDSVSSELKRRFSINNTSPGRSELALDSASGPTQVLQKSTLISKILETSSIIF